MSSSRDLHIRLEGFATSSRNSLKGFAGRSKMGHRLRGPFKTLDDPVTLFIVRLAADEPVRAKLPDIAKLANCRLLSVPARSGAGGCSPGLVQDEVDLLVGEPAMLEVEFGTEHLEFAA